MNKKTKKILHGTGIGLIALILIALIIAVSIFYDVICVYLTGYALDTSGIDFDKTSAVAEQIEEEGIVLLKNSELSNGKNSLPLQKDGDGKIKVNVFGWSSISPAYSGGGSGDSGSADSAVSFYKGLTNAGIEYNTAIESAYKSYKSGRDSDSYWSKSYPYLNLIEPSGSWLSSNVDMAAAKSYSDTAIMFITRLGGEHQDLPKRQVKWGGAATEEDRTYLDITSEEEELLQLLKTTGFENIIVICNSINTMNLDFCDDESVDGVLNVGAFGQYGANAIGNVLTGKVNPSGKLADTYVYDFSTSSTYANSPDGQNINTAEAGVKQYLDRKSDKQYNDKYYIDYQESIYVGYKWYETADAEGFWNSDFAKNKWNIQNGYEDVVQYPFGYGLSYTEFEWNVTSVSPASGADITPDTQITIELTVQNVGDVAGMDVVQLYYAAPYYEGGIEKSAKNLVAFAKTIELEPNEAQKVTLTFTASDMKSYDYNDANGDGHEGYELERGDYKVYLSTDAHTVATCKDATVTYSVVQTKHIDKVDGNDVYNRFTGDEAIDDGISSDGSSWEQDVEYMTRESFATTFPEEHEGTRSLGSYYSNTTWNSYRDTDETYTQGSGGSLRLYDENGNPNLDLIKKLGKNYDDKTWTELLNQLTEEELFDLFLYGGYQMKEVDSIGKPLLYDLDGPMGLNGSVMSNKDYGFTFFPSETVLAQSWSEKLAYTYGLAIGVEAQAGVSGWYAPAANLHRSPFGGRNYEYYSEDGFLSGKMAANTIKGAANNGVYCYLKHFAVNETANIGSGASIGLHTWVTEQAIRETYLQSFEIAVKEGEANAIMNAYSCIGATWCGGSQALLTDVLREEWGFKGSVITDAWTMDNPIAKTVYNFDLGLRSGTNGILNSANTPAKSYISDKTSTTTLAALRESAHKRLYTLCNTIARQAEYNEAIANGSNPDGAMFAVEVSGKGVGSQFQVWLLLLIIGEVLAFAALGFWAYMVFFREMLANRKASKITAESGKTANANETVSEDVKEEIKESSVNADEQPTDEPSKE